VKKPKPLKGKRQGVYGVHHVWAGNDIKSAVEWLKEELKKINPSGRVVHIEHINQTIDEAFADVTEVIPSRNT
jgi:hypothetical protein